MTPNQIKRAAHPLPQRFAIDRLPFDTTLARQVTKQNLTNFNNVLWVSEHSYSFLRKSFTKIQQPTGSSDLHGRFENEDKWKGGVDEFRTWARQHVLISAASLLEVYIQSAATAALYAVPELVDRSLLGVPSFSFIKHPEKTPKRLKPLVSSHVDSLTHGLWADRLASMAQIFGSLPAPLVALTETLQSIQDRRNRIAHSYGFGGELRRTPWEPLQAIEVTPTQLVSAIKAVSLAIRLADQGVFGPRVGAYEILHEYHVWLEKNKSAHHQKVSGWLATKFKDHFGNAFGRTPGPLYIKQMIEYYDRLS